MTPGVRESSLLACVQTLFSICCQSKLLRAGGQAGQHSNDQQLVSTQAQPPHHANLLLVGCINPSPLIGQFHLTKTSDHIIHCSFIDYWSLYFTYCLEDILLYFCSCTVYFPFVSLLFDVFQYIVYSLSCCVI